MTINAADTAWILISAALVMLMTPALALFYGGMVRRKNLLSTMMMSFAIIALVGILWVLYGYSLAFGTDHAGIIGGFNFLGLNGVGQEPSSVYATTVPHLAYMIYQGMFAVITVALITGAVVERMKFSALLVFAVSMVYPGICTGSTLGLGLRRVAGKTGRTGFCRRNCGAYYGRSLGFSFGYLTGPAQWCYPKRTAGT